MMMMMVIINNNSFIYPRHYTTDARGAEQMTKTNISNQNRVKNPS